MTCNGYPYGDGGKTAAEIGARIRALRERSHISPRQLAKRLGVTDDAVAKMQRGESVGKFVKLAALARTLNTTPNELLGFDSAQINTEVLEATLESCFEALGLPEAEALSLSKIVLSVIQEPQPPPNGVDPQTQARIQSAYAVRQALRLKQPLS